MTAVQDFVADPLGFMADNIIVPNWSSSEHDPSTQQVETMTFVTKPPAQGVGRKMGRDLGLYWLVPTGMIPHLHGVTPDGNTFNAYFCPYRDNSTLGTTISNGADFMFTATMDGCSLGVGSPAQDGSRLVYHSNLGGRGDDQNLILSMTLGASQDRIFGPQSYRTEYGQGVLRSTTFGVRDSGTNSWTFHAQIYFPDLQASPPRYFLRRLVTF
jgi:hypothetical protein